jgi:hypothetical protein
VFTQHTAAGTLIVAQKSKPLWRCPTAPSAFSVRRKHHAANWKFQVVWIFNPKLPRPTQTELEPDDLILQSDTSQTESMARWPPILYDKTKIEIEMNFYQSAVDDQLRHADDRPSIGLLLCKERDNLTVEYALRDLKKPIGVAQWQTKLVESLPRNLKGNLPTVAEIEAELDNTRPK